jgi:hypothetical protein
VAQGYDPSVIQTRRVSSSLVSLDVFEGTVTLARDANFGTAYQQLRTVFAVSPATPSPYAPENWHLASAVAWFLIAFCPQLRPRQCMLLEAGVQPGAETIALSTAHFREHPNSAGVRAADMASSFHRQSIYGWGLFMEQLLTSTLDNSIGGFMGAVTDLPVAFCVYRFNALHEQLQDDIHGGELSNALAQYAAQLSAAVGGSGSARSMLEGGRVLPFKLLTEPRATWAGRGTAYWWELHADRRLAVRKHDVMCQFTDFCGSQARQCAEHFFACRHHLAVLPRMWTQGAFHGYTRKLALTAGALPSVLQLLFRWFAPSNFLIAASFYALHLNGAQVPTRSVYYCILA